MPTTVVSDTKALVAALKGAHAGDTILLAPGAYSDFQMRDVKFDGAVTIASADPDQMAQISGLLIKNVQGLTFKQLEIVSRPGDTAGSVSVFNSAGVHFDSVKVHGTMDGDPTNDGSGIRLKDSRNVSVTNSEFQQLFTAIGQSGNDGVLVAGNYIHDIRMDGVRGGGSSNVSILNNYFTDFYKVTGDHADAIQFWSTAPDQTMRNITISGNVVDQGVGTAIQGIFLRNQDAGSLFDGVLISDNLILGGNPNGIAVDGATRLTIEGNTVVPRSQSVTWIDVTNTVGALVAQNTARMVLTDGSFEVAQVGNNLAMSITDQGAAVLKAWLVAHPAVAALLPRAVAASAEGASIHPAGADTLFSQNSLALPATTHNLILTGLANADAWGNALDNLLVGNDSNNRLYGGSGNDVLEGGVGDDVIDGGSGSNTASYEHAAAGVTVSLSRYTGARADGVKQNTGGAGTDVLFHVQHLTGSQHADTLTGWRDNNILAGGDGDDRLQGAGGADQLYGGAGADTFMFKTLADSTWGAAGRASIMDFSHAEGDRIDLSKIDARSSTSKNEKFAYVSAFSNHAGELTTSWEDGHYVVKGDVNGDGGADFAINVFADRPLSASDFFL